MLFLSQLNRGNIPDGFLQQDIRHEGQRHLIFATQLQLDYLTNAKVWFVDGTFKAIKEPFKQLFSIHSFIRSGDKMKQVPLCFVVMSRRQTSDYEEVLDAILDLLPREPLVEEIVVDFEKAIWAAFSTTMPDLRVRGCWFHWAQAVFRKVKEFGLRAAYVRQYVVRMYIRELMALPNLPANHIEAAFYELKQKCPATPGMDRLHELLNYIERTWITSRPPPAAWSTFKRSVRTNNDAEGWHNRINGQVPHDRPNLYLLIKALYDEAELLPLQVSLVTQQKLYRHQTRESKTKQEALRRLWEEYKKENRTITTSEYLRRCGALSDHSEN